MKQGRYTLFGLLVVVSLVLSLVAACASAPAPTPTVAPQAPPKSAAQPTSAPAPTKAPAPAPTKAPEAVKPAEPAKPAAAPAKVADPVKAAVPVKIGLKNSASDAAAYIGIQKGYFKEQGIDAEVVEIGNAAQMIQLLATGELPVAGGSATPGLFNAIQRNIPLRIVADKGTSSPGYTFMSLVVRKDLWDSGAVKSFKDLKGKKVAISAGKAGSSNNVDLAIAMSSVGLSWKDVEVVDLNFPDMNTAFGGKSIDAAFQVEPLVTVGVQKDLLVPMKAVSDIYPDHQLAVLLYSPKFASEQTDVAKKFMVAMVKATRDYNDAFIKKDKKARDEIVPLMLKYTNLKSPELYDQVAFPALNPDGYVNTGSLTKDQDWYFDNGFLKEKVNLKEVIDNQFADYAVQVLGKYKK